MYAFLDESGIHLKTGHSVFVVILVTIHDIERVETGLVDVERRLNFSHFHWSKMRWYARLAAFETLATLPFTFKTVTFRNPIVTEERVLKDVLGSLLCDRDITYIYIDGKKSKAYSAKLKRSLRDYSVKTVKLATVNDRVSPGIRIADLIAGALRHQIDKPSFDSKRLCRLIAEKEA